MATRVAVVLLLNVLFFTLVSSSYVPHHHNLKPTCPRDILKLKVCANVLHLVDVSLPPAPECCALIKDLIDLEAAVCLCTALNAHVLGVNLNVPVCLNFVLNRCGKKVPSGYHCSKTH